MFTGNDEAEIAVRRAAGIMDQGRQDFGGEQGALHTGDLLRILEVEGDNRPRGIREGEAGLTQGGFGGGGILFQSPTESPVASENLQ